METLQSAREILDQRDRRVERFFIPEWNKHVYLRTITANERDAFEAAMLNEEGRLSPGSLVGQRARFAAMVLCDEHGNRLFTREDDIRALQDKNAAALDRILDAGRAMNKMGPLALSDAEKNLETIPDENSISD